VPYPRRMVDRFTRVTQDVCDTLPTNSEKDVKQLLNRIQGHQDVLKVGPKGEVCYNGESIRGSNMSELVTSLFTGEPPTNDKGMEELVAGLKDSGIPVPKMKKKKKEEPTTPKGRGRTPKKKKTKKEQSGHGLYSRASPSPSPPPGKRICIQYLYKV
jgi:hypothetical protein